MKAFSANIYKRSLPRWPSYTCASGNRLAWDASETATNLYAYDGAGRLTNHVVNGQTRTFAYNFQGRMTSLTDIDGSVFAYEFDGEGNRLSQSLNDCLSKRFVYDGADVLLELNPTNGVAYAWVNGPGIDQPIERLLFIDGSPRARRVFHSDALGSIAALTDPSGLVTQSYAYSAFGSLRSSSGTDLNRVTFTAREQLGDSQGWMYYRSRTFIPRLGRFATTDFHGFVDGGNVWTYAMNIPLIYIDPWGFQHDDPSLYELYRVLRELISQGELSSLADDCPVAHKMPVVPSLLSLALDSANIDHGPWVPEPDSFEGFSFTLYPSTPWDFFQITESLYFMAGFKYSIPSYDDYVPLGPDTRRKKLR